MQDAMKGQFFLKQYTTGLNLDFSFSYSSCLTQTKEPSLPYDLLIA